MKHKKTLIMLVNSEDSKYRGWLLSQLPTNSNGYMIQHFLRNQDKSRTLFQRILFDAGGSYHHHHHKGRIRSQLLFKWRQQRHLF